MTSSVGLLCENIKPSTKPEVHTISHCRHGSIDHAHRWRSRKIARRSDMWFLQYVSEHRDRQTDWQTDMLVTILHTPSGGEVKIYSKDWTACADFPTGVVVGRHNCVTYWRYVTLVVVLSRPALSASSSASITALRWEPVNVHVLFLVRVWVLTLARNAKKEFL